ncbi:MAG: hypothetical protein ACXABY_29495 [Candidatus Thorarchaeota archaeon]
MGISNADWSGVAVGEDVGVIVGVGVDVDVGEGEGVDVREEGCVQADRLIIRNIKAQEITRGYMIPSMT